MGKALLNIDIPADGGKLTTGRIVGTAVTVGVIFAAWNWSSKIPVVGQYVTTGKMYILKGLGF